MTRKASATTYGRNQSDECCRDRGRGVGAFRLLVREIIGFIRKEKNSVPGWQMRVKTEQVTTQLWSESITTHLSRSPLAGVLMVAFSIWLLGLLAFAIENQALSYIGDLAGYGFVFLFLPALLLGTRYFHRLYLKGVDDFQPHVKLSNENFARLKNRLDRMLCDSRIVLPIGIIAFVLLEDNFAPIREAILKRNLSGVPATPVWLWSTGLAFINWLLFATAIWLVISVWTGIYYISRKPLNFTPARFSNEFRGLARFNLEVTGFYFLGIAIALLLNLYQTRNAFSVVFFYALLAAGAVGFFAPHYNIHRTLLTGKLNELQRLDKEIAHFAEELHNLHLNESKDLQEYVKLTARIIALQANERRIAEADDWPLDHSQISTFLILIIVPIILNLITNPLP